MEQSLIRLEWDIHAFQEHLLLHRLLPRGHRASKRSSRGRGLRAVAIDLRGKIAVPHFSNLTSDGA